MVREKGGIVTLYEAIVIHGSIARTPYGQGIFKGQSLLRVYYDKQPNVKRKFLERVARTRRKPPPHAKRRWWVVHRSQVTRVRIIEKIPNKRQIIEKEYFLAIFKKASIVR